MIETDVLIVGGGLIGASLAIALANTAYKVTMVEAMSSKQMQQDDFDARSIALSDASHKILQGLDVWSAIAKQATPIQKIHVSKKGLWGRTLLNAYDFKKDAFGVVVELNHLNQSFQPKLDQIENLQYINPAKLKALTVNENHSQATIEHDGEESVIQAKLIIAADGTNSYVRKLLNIESVSHDYHQHAIVANIGLQRAHQFDAYERFTENGLIAMLPMTQQRAALVWAVDEDSTKKLQLLSDQAFLAELQKAFGYRLGRLVKVGKRVAFPLGLERLAKSCHQNIIFVGNAAQTLHPVAGQGFNLGLRDVAILAELLHDMQTDLNVTELGQAYETQRQGDKNRIIMSTNQLVKFFGLNQFPFSLLQSSGLVLTDMLPMLKHILVHHAMGYSSQNAKLTCDIPLEH